MGRFGNEPIDSIRHAVAYAQERKPRGMRITTVEVANVQAIRRAHLRAIRRRPRKPDTNRCVSGVPSGGAPAIMP
jgi:hypothetical protein